MEFSISPEQLVNLIGYALMTLLTVLFKFAKAEIKRYKERVVSLEEDQSKKAAEVTNKLHALELILTKAVMQEQLQGAINRIERSIDNGFSQARDEVRRIYDKLEMKADKADL